MGKVTMVFLTLALCFSFLITVKAQPEFCGKGEDCLGNDVGYNCVAGRCGCVDSNADCPAGDLCNKAKCVECSVRGDCAIGNSGGLGCYDGKCGCQGDDDCGGAEVCKDGKCKSKEPSPAMCPPLC